jgi:hypothetical protein
MGLAGQGTAVPMAATMFACVAAALAILLTRRQRTGSFSCLLQNQPAMPATQAAPRERDAAIVQVEQNKPALRNG